MLRLSVYAPPDRAAAVGVRLGPLPGVRHLVIGNQTFGGMVEVSGDIDAESADAVLEILREFQLGAEDVTLWRASSVQPLGWARRRGRAGGNAAVWTEVIGRATESARPGLTYLLYMVAAGVIAGVGVINSSSILVVGAMAISPDLYPICATAIGLVDRRRQLWTLALFTLVLGLGVVSVAATVSTLMLRITGRIDDDLDLAGTALGQSLTVVGPGTVLVALAAGMAGMLAYETAGSAAVGVAISVTTIPAAAYVGDSIALQGFQDAAGGLEVLGTNVAGIVAAGALTVYVQRRWRRRGT
jgi:uncharacterized hydrophobic protein (TIGR00271 family)